MYKRDFEHVHPYSPLSLDQGPTSQLHILFNSLNLGSVALVYGCGARHWRMSNQPETTSLKKSDSSSSSNHQLTTAPQLGVRPQEPLYPLLSSPECWQAVSSSVWQPCHGSTLASQNPLFYGPSPSLPGRSMVIDFSLAFKLMKATRFLISILSCSPPHMRSFPSACSLFSHCIFCPLYSPL